MKADIVTTMDFMDDATACDLIDELCYFAAHAWWRIALRLDLDRALRQQVANPEIQPPITVFGALFTLMRTHRTPVADYRAAVEKECPAALRRPRHTAYIASTESASIARTTAAVARQLPPPREGMLAIEAASAMFSSLEMSQVLRLSIEAIEHGLTLDVLRPFLQPSYYNRFVGNVVQISSLVPVMQMIELFKYFRQSGVLLAHYAWLIDHAASDALGLLGEKYHAETLGGVAPLKPPFAV